MRQPRSSWRAVCLQGQFCQSGKCCTNHRQGQDITDETVNNHNQKLQNKVVAFCRRLIAAHNHTELLRHERQLAMAAASPVRFGDVTARTWSCGKLAGLPQVDGRAPEQEHARISVDKLGKAPGVPQVDGSMPTHTICFRDFINNYTLTVITR